MGRGIPRCLVCDAAAASDARRIPSDSRLIAHLQRTVPLLGGRIWGPKKRVCKTHFHNYDAYKRLKLKEGETWVDVYLSPKCGLNLYDAAFTRAGNTDRAKRTLSRKRSKEDIE